MIKTILSIAFLTTILGCLILLFIQNSKDDRLQIGANLPALKYSGISGSARLQNQNKPIIIVFFSPSCEHCRYQLNLFNDHIKEFKNIVIYFLTTIPNFFEQKLNTHWAALNHSNNVNFGIVSKSEYKKIFGSAITPSFFFFSEKGKLKNKIKGELRLEKILEITKSLTSGRAQ